MRPFLYSLILLLFIYPVAKAQRVDTTSVAYLMDDGNLSSPQNIIKINLVSPVIGDLAFYYERLLFKYVSVEAGVGVLLPYYVPDGLTMLNNEKEIVNPDLGYSLWIHPRFYVAGKAPEYQYIGLQYRIRHYNLKSGQQIDYIDMTFNCGVQFFLGKRLMFDYNLGVGFRQRKYPVPHIDNKPDGEGIIGIAMPLNFRLGYAF